MKKIFSASSWPLKIGRCALFLGGVLLVTGCAHRSNTGCDPCTQSTSACQNQAPCASPPGYAVSWDRTCADYPVTYRAVVAEVRGEAADARGGGVESTRRMRAGDLVEAGRIR